MIKIFIADDNPLIRDGLRRILAAEPGFAIVGEAPDGEQAVTFVRDNDLDVALLDVNMPGLSGTQVLKAIKMSKPVVGLIALTVHDQDDHMLAVTKAGASACIRKDSDPAFLVQTIYGVARGDSYIPPAITTKVLNEFRHRSRKQRRAVDPLGLTRREAEILGLLALGMRNYEISERLLISQRTVKNHLTHVFGKLGVPDRTRAALYAVKAGMAALMAFLLVRSPHFLHLFRL